MYLIVSYDVDSKLCPKYMKILRKYLFHIQNSVFEGELTDKEFKDLKKELSVFGNNDIIFYIVNSTKAIKKESMDDYYKDFKYLIY